MPAVSAMGTISADPLGILAAFGAGILSFLSPCVLPLVPGYVSMVSGLSAAELEGGASPGQRRPLAPLLRGVGTGSPARLAQGGLDHRIGHRGPAARRRARH